MLIDFDDIKQQFLKRMNLPPGRSSVENREQLRASNVWKKMADKWNDKSFEPETVAMPDVSRRSSDRRRIFFFAIHNLLLRNFFWININIRKNDYNNKCGFASIKPFCVISTCSQLA